MTQRIRDQMVEQGLVTEEQTPEGQRAAERAAKPAEPEKALPPPFEAPARGVILDSNSGARAVRTCIECGSVLRTAPNRGPRCAECVSDDT
jgi:hypothetical protein